MNATEILADNLRRLKASDRLTDYRDTGWLEIALEGRGGSLNVFAIEHLASMLGVEPWQLLAPLLGKGAWVDRSFAPHLPSFVLVTTPPAGIAARDVGSVVCASGVWTSYVERGNEFTDHPTEAAARAAVEAALFESKP